MFIHLGVRGRVRVCDRVSRAQRAALWLVSGSTHSGVESKNYARRGCAYSARVMSRSCPALSMNLVPPETVPLAPTASWRPAPEPPPRRNSSHFYMYVPTLATEMDQHNLRAILHANQFPSDPAACDRALILYDDALSAGLGYSARLIALALLVAVQEKRVLHNLPHSTARWCARAPHTLGCYYEPMTHCPPPTNVTASPKWSTRGSSFGLEGRQTSKRSSAIVRISTSQVHRATFWYKFHPPQALYAATHELLYKPRRWVQDIAECIMRAARLDRGDYAVVHARFSVEKKKERGGKLPGLEEYQAASKAFLTRSNTSRLFLQTSTPEAVDLFEKWSSIHGWQLSYTQNARSDHDIWMSGGVKKAEYSAVGERTSVVAQTVNAIVASRSRHFLSPSSSMWTQFIRSLMAHRIGDRLSNGGASGSEVYEDCLQALYSGSDGASNMSQSELKRCTRSVPQLMSIHRHTGEERET